MVALKGLGRRLRPGPPQEPVDLITQGDLARDARDWLKAAQFYQQAVTETPARADIWVQLGHAQKESGKLDGAEAAYRAALRLTPDDADLYLQLGHLLKMMRRFEEAGAAYMTSLKRDPAQDDALRELNALAEHGVVFSRTDLVEALTATPEDLADEPDSLKSDAGAAIERLLKSGGLDEVTAQSLEAALAQLQAVAPVTETPPETATGAGPAMVFDMADLLSYFRNARLPTGIQRVQIEAVSSLLRQAARPGSPHQGLVKVCAFSESLDDWVELPAPLFLRLCDMSLSGGEITAPDWQAMLERLDLFTRTAEPMAFPMGAFLVNLGTSWWLQNYFLHVRRAKARYGIHYVPFVHDLIPIMTPEHCIRELTQDFITWALGVFHHAEFFLANSNATKRDLVAVADRMGQTVDPDRIRVIRLDGDFRKTPALKAGTAKDANASPAKLKMPGIVPGGYVLFVSTLESRKNHLGAFNAWASLIRERGPRAVPKLVCVGNEGWLNDAIHAKLRSSEALRERVVLLSRLSDAELAALYDNCLFTLYPSHYEGWGLPVTESLCHGKVPVVADASSLPEAGGEFAEYFEAGSDSALTKAVERMIFDPVHRAAREKVIAERFQPRAWADIGAEIGEAINTWREAADAPESAEDAPAAGPDAAPLAMPARLGAFYPIRRNFAVRVWPDMVAGEMFRSGPGWWWPDDWGVWTRPGGGEFAIRIAKPHGRLRAFFRLRGLIEHYADWTIELSPPGLAKPAGGRMGHDERLWVSIDLPASDTGLSIVGRLGAPQFQDLGPRTDNLDRRVTSIGLEGFYICEIDDLASRLDFSEALATGGLDRLTPGYGAQ